MGEEFGAQAFVLDGEVQFILPHGDYVFQGDTGVPIGHLPPMTWGRTSWRMQRNSCAER